MEINYRTGLRAVSFLVLAGVIQPASAIMVDVSGSFDPGSLTNTNYIFKRFYNQDDINPAPVKLPGNLQSSTDSVAYFGWGIDVTDSIIQRKKIQSHFWFNGTGSIGGGSAANVTAGDTFSLGTFTYTNEQTIFSGGLVGIDFLIDINIEGTTLNTQYQLEIDNTVNSGPTPSDTARLLNPQPLPQLFNIGGIDYEIMFNGFSRDGGLTFETEATLPEGTQTSAEIFATISQVAVVPVPAAFWLFASGLIGLIGLSKHNKRK